MKRKHEHAEREQYRAEADMIDVTHMGDPYQAEERGASVKRLIDAIGEYTESVEQYVAEQRRFEWTLLGIAGVATLVLTLVLLWR